MLTRQQCCCGGSVGSCSGSCCDPCIACPIPKCNLVFSWTDNGASPPTTPGSVPMWFNNTSFGHPSGGDFWVSDVVYFDNPAAYRDYYRFWLQCNSLGFQQFYQAFYPTNTPSQLVYANATVADFGIDSATCNPFHIQLGQSATYPNRFCDLSTSFTSSMCCQTVAVTGCNGSGLPGATVNIRTGAGGTILATGTTDNNGTVTLLWTSACGSVYIEAICSRFTTSGTTVTATAGGTTTIALSVASGYHCTGCSAIPLADTIHLTDSVWGGPTTLTYSSGNWVSGTTSWSYTSDSCCGTHTFGMIYTLTGSTCQLSATYGTAPLVPGNPICPNGTSRQRAVSVGSTTVINPGSCGSATAWSLTATPSTTACAGDANYIYPSGGTWTCTE